MNIVFKSFESKRRFGVELEINRAVSQQNLCKAIQAAAPNENCDIQGWGYSCDNPYWIVKTDSTCGDQGNRDLDGGGYEVASPVGFGSGHLKSIDTVTKAIKQLGAKVNNYCALHCQVEIKDFTVDQAAILMANWIKIEAVFSHMVPERRNTSDFCKFFSKNKKKMAELVKCENARDFWNAIKLKNMEPTDKRTSLTMVNFQRTLAGGKWDYFHRPTVEIRLPEGTVEGFEVKNWARLFVQFVESSIRYKELPPNLRVANLEESLEILGFSEKGKFAVLSPGLHETKAWMLYRILTHSKNPSVIKEAKAIYMNMFDASIPWRFEFPQVLDLNVPMTKDIPVTKKPDMSSVIYLKDLQSVISTDDDYYGYE